MNDRKSHSLLALFTLLMATSAFAQFGGLATEVRRFVMQIEEASSSVDDAMVSMTAEYTSGAAVISDRTYDFTSGTDKSQKQNPIATIKYGYVDNSNDAFHVTTGGDNVGMYIMEVTFKTNAQMTDIHPSLNGKTVLFVAHGPGPLTKTIYTSSNTAGTANLVDYDSMSKIGGFMCFLKANRCTSSTGSMPVKTCDATAEVNGGETPGFLVSQSQAINLFYYVSGPFALCADQNAVKDSMGA